MPELHGLQEGIGILAIPLEYVNPITEPKRT
jgi:hypothetical protein